MSPFSRLLHRSALALALQLPLVPLALAQAPALDALPEACVPYAGPTVTLTAANALQSPNWTARECAGAAIAKAEDVNTAMAHGDTLVHLAIYNRNLEALRLLIQLNARLTVAGGAPKLTPLILSMARSFPEGMVELFKAGLKTDQIYEDKNTFLHEAARYGSKPGAEYALAHGVELDAKNAAGQTALELAGQRLEELKQKKKDLSNSTQASNLDEAIRQVDEVRKYLVAKTDEENRAAKPTSVLLSTLTHVQRTIAGQSGNAPMGDASGQAFSGQKAPVSSMTIGDIGEHAASPVPVKAGIGTQ